MRIGWTTDTVTTDASRALHYTLLWGLDGVVLRTVGKAGERVPFVNEAPLRKRLEEDDVPVFAIDPGLFEGDLAARASWMNEVDAFNDVAAFCRRMGVDTVMVGALASGADGYDESAAADAIRQLGDAAARAALRLAVRNEADTAVSTGKQLASLLARVSHSAVLADWRPFDARRAGEDPEVGLAAFRDVSAIASVVVQDAATDGTPEVPGQGQIDWDALLFALASAGWDGLVALEMHGRPPGTFGLHTASAMISAIRRAKRAVVP